MTRNDKENNSVVEPHNLCLSNDLLIESEKTEDTNKYFFLDESNFDNWWANLNSRIEKKSFSEHEEDIFKYSVILKSFRNEYETDGLLSENSIKLLKEGKIDVNKKHIAPCLQKTSIEILVPGYNPNSFIPNTSSLTYNEMLTCLTIIEAGSSLTQEQFHFWKMNKSKLEEEQAQYIDFAKEQWDADGSKRHTVIKEDVKELVDSLWKARLQRVFMCPKFYVQKENTSLIPTVEDVELKFVKELESLGRPAKYYLPDLWTFVVNVNTVLSTIEKPQVGNLSYHKQVHPKLSNAGYHPEVSNDKLAERLAKENGVNVVMSSSAFNCLVDNQSIGLNSNWSLPVKVIDYQAEHGVKRIAFIDKKLTPLQMTAVDRNRYYAKLALKKLFVRMPRTYRDPASSIYDAEAVETFGFDSPVKKLHYKNLKKRKKMLCFYCLKKEERESRKEQRTLDTSEHVKENGPIKNGDASDSDESNSFYIDVEEENATSDKPKSHQENTDEKEIAEEVCNNFSLFSSPEEQKCCCKYEWVQEQETDSPKVIKKRLNYKIQYNLWDFTSSASQNYMSKNCSKDLKLIIRTTTEGQVTEKVEKKDELIYRQYKLSPKVEYQTEFGAEAATLSEILREWASVYIRPPTKLARVRLDGVTGELIQIQQFTASELIAECHRLYDVNPKDRLSTLHSVLVKLSDLPVGTYILSHKPQNGTFVTFYKSVESGGGQIYNLHLDYNLVDPSEVAPQRSPFPPLDPTVITPTFKYFKRVPCTFAPKRYKAKKSLLKDNTAINPPKISKTKKKKKKKGKK